MAVHQDGPSIHWVWLLLCGTLGAGLALWSLYLVGLVVLTIAVIVLGRAPISPRKRVATLLAMLGGFEAAITTLMALYWLVWYQRDGGFYVYLLVLGAAGAAILSCIPLANWTRVVVRRR
jgi:hypothetical protein